MQTTPTDAARHSAYLQAYQLFERVQGEDYLVAAAELVTAAERAEQSDWPEVLFILQAADVVHRMARSPEQAVADRAAQRLLTSAESLPATAYQAIALGLCAVSAQQTGDNGALLAHASRAVALLDDENSPDMARCIAYVITGAAFNTLRLWELTDELYEQALAFGPACDASLQTEAVAANRPLIRLEWALNLLQSGYQDAALDQLARVSDAAELALSLELRPLWRNDVRAFIDIARLLGPDGTSSLAAIRQSVEHYHADLVAGGDLESLALLDAALALTELRAGNRQTALRAAEQLRPPQSFTSGARSFPLWVRAEILAADLPPAVAAAQRDYGRLASQLNWRSRDAVLAAARAQIAVERRKAEHDRLHREVQTDALTGLQNRLVFDRWLRTSVLGSQPTALLLIDLDGFKPINDSFGHACGDEVLRRVGRLLRESSRPDDVSIRQGGDEFALILQGAHLTREIATDRARQLAGAIRNEPWHELADGLAVTVSIGLACADLGVDSIGDDGQPVDAQSLYVTADTALYLSKRSDREVTAARRVPDRTREIRNAVDTPRVVRKLA